MPATRARYGHKERERALALAAQIGPVAAGERLGINAGTIRAWGTRSRQIAADLVAIAPPAALSSASSRWDGRQGDVADRWGRIVDGGQEAAEELLKVGRYRDAKEAALTAAIATDKAQLLSGHATSRSESRSTVATVNGDRVAALLAALSVGKGLGIPGEIASDQHVLPSGVRPRVLDAVSELVERAGAPVIPGAPARGVVAAHAAVDDSPPR